MNKVGLWDGFSLITKIFIGIFLVFIIVVACLAVFMGASSATNTAAQQSNAQSDLAKFSDFHKQLMTNINKMQAAFNGYQKDGRKAVESGDIYSLYDSAKNLNDVAVQYDIALYPPDLNNDSANNDEQELVRLYRAYNGALLMLSQNIMQAANNDLLTPEEANNSKMSANAVSLIAIQIAMQVVKIYGDLGVKDVNQIDIDNGGLSPKKTNPQS